MDIFDRAQQQEEFFRQNALSATLRKGMTRNTPGGAVLEKDCLGCGDPIPAKRLKANPAATHCVECQKIKERRDSNGGD